jgi:transposase, IS5 family
VMRKAPKGGDLDPLDVQINRIIAKVRAKVEHADFGNTGQ